MAISYKPLWHLLVEREMNKEDLKRAANITSKFNILAIRENWCIDSIINIPVVYWLEKNNENKKLKVIDTDSYSKFMPNEKVITPTFIIMNQEYQEIGKWVQYPKRIIDVVESKDQFELQQRKGDTDRENMLQIY